ncbi:hypothetical protein GF323_04220 [Candidatus Woesearchaeota archaeon]|nr:hypothetical protein [Candidatus Woesearchaeota archaeon]
MHRDIFFMKEEERAFRLCNGGKIESIKELYEQLDRMSEEVFLYHANEDKNDFYNWIKDVFQQNNLAHRIRYLKDKHAMKKAIGGWISELLHEGHADENKAKLTDKMTGDKLLPGEKLVMKDAEQDSTCYRNDINGLKKPIHAFSGAVDFILGFVVGILAILILTSL